MSMKELKSEFAPKAIAELAAALLLPGGTDAEAWVKARLEEPQTVRERAVSWAFQQRVRLFETAYELEEEYVNQSERDE